MRLAELPTFDQWLATMQQLLLQVVTWFLTAPHGRHALVLILVLLVLWAIKVLRFDGNADDSFDIRDW